jgi:hypothetical protein
MYRPGQLGVPRLRYRSVRYRLRSTNYSAGVSRRFISAMSSGDATENIAFNDEVGKVVIQVTRISRVSC